MSRINENSIDYRAQPKDYWIATNAINITRNALGKPNRIQCSVVSGAAILCYIEGVDGLGYDNGHRFRTWPLAISPTYFNSNTEKYVYVAIPRSASVGTQAVVVFPSEQLDIYGVNADDEQVGSTDYYYIWLQGILTATDGTSNREWQQTIDFGKKGTDEDLYDDTSSEWFQYSKVNNVVTFLKNIRMKAGTTFQNLILGNKELTGVATSNTAYTDSDALVATPGYVESQYLSKTHESTAQEQVGFLKGLWVKAKNLFGIDANGNAKLNSVTSDDIHSNGYSDDNIGGYGYHVYKDANGNGHVCTDILDVRKKARFTELEIRRLSYINADQVQSMAASKVEKVLPIAADGAVISSDDTTTTVVAYRCLAVADDGSTATKNGWALGDQARCQTFNISTPGNYQNVENRFYWRLVVRVGQCYDDGTIYPSQEEHDGKVYHFFDLANIMDVTADAGDEFDDFFADGHATEDVYEGYMITLVNNERTNLNDIPATEDAVVQMGNRIDTDRMGFFITKADNLNTGPYIYAGVNNFTLVGKMITKITPAEVLISARKLKVFSDPNAGDAEPLVHYRGDWELGSTSYYYDEWDYQGSRWLCLYQGAEGTTEAPGATPANWKEISLKGDSEVTVYKQSATQPATPTGNTIPPTGWHKEPKWFASGEILGEGERGAFNVRTITFTTTKVNQKIRVRLEASSEDGYDFIICGAIDEELDSEALNGEKLANDEDGLIETYHATTGTDVNEFVLTASSIGEYFIQIAYTKDGSNDHNDDLGRYWVGFDDIAIWASVATFSGSTNVSGWSTPVRWNGEDGQDGTDGTSPIIADLDNEMDGVACDVGGDSDHSQTCTTTASLLQGSTKKSFTLKIREWDEDNQVYNEITQSGSILTDVDINWTNNSDNSKTITFTFSKGVTINDKREFIVVMIADNVEYKAVFTVNGVLPGANGEPATLYQIIPSQDKMAFSRLSSRGLTPDNQYLTFTVKKTVGNETTIIHTAQLEQNNLIARYSTSDPPASKTSGVAWGTGSGSGTTQITFNNIGNAVISKNVTFQQIYIALFGSDGTLHDRETIPVIKDGANGTDGEDGEPGADAWTLTVNPSPIIIEQDIETPSSFGLPINISFIAKCGDNTATVGTIGSGDVSNNLGLTVSRVTTGTDYNNGVRLQITGYNKNSQTGRYATNGYIACTIPLSYGSGTTARSTSMAVRIQVGVNLLGEWETKIVGDAETSVATKLTNAVNGEGEITVFNQVGTYIRSASENTAKLTETIGARSNGNNLFGFSKGVRFGTFIPFVQGYGIVSNTSADTQLRQAWVNNLGFDGKTGYYVVTCEAKMLGGSSKDVTFNLYGTGTNDNPSSVTKTVGTTWTKLTMVFYIASFADNEASRNGQFYINNIPDTNRIAIRKLQIEHGSVPSDFGVCKEDEMAASVPVSIDWSVPSAFTKASSGGPDGGECYYNNTHPASGSHIEINAFNISLPYGVYTMSFWAKANVDEYTIQCICGDVNDYDTNVMPDLISGEYGVMESYQESGMNKYGSVNIKLSTQWRKYYVPYYLASAGNMYIVPMRINYGYTGGSSGTFYISKIKFEKGYVTSANRTEYQTVMKQTAHNIDFSVLVNSMEKAGIHLYTSNNTTPESENEIDEGVIDLVAGKVNFKMPGGGTNPKISIDPPTGALRAVDGYFSGKIHAVEGDFTDITSQDEHVGIVGTPTQSYDSWQSKTVYWRGLAIGEDPVNGTNDLATIGGRFDAADKVTGYGYIALARNRVVNNVATGSEVTVNLRAHDGEIYCKKINAEIVKTTTATTNSTSYQADGTVSKILCNRSGNQTVTLPANLGLEQIEVWVRKTGTGTVTVKDVGSSSIGTVTESDGWKLFVYVSGTGWC